MRIVLVGLVQSSGVFLYTSSARTPTLQHLDRCRRAALELDKDVGRVDSLRRVRVLELQDALVHIARPGCVDAHGLVGTARPHEPTGDVQVVDSCCFERIRGNVWWQDLRQKETN